MFNKIDVGTTTLINKKELMQGFIYFSESASDGYLMRRDDSSYDIKRVIEMKSGIIKRHSSINNSGNSEKIAKHYLVEVKGSAELLSTDSPFFLGKSGRNGL